MKLRFKDDDKEYDYELCYKTEGYFIVFYDGKQIDWYGFPFAFAIRKATAEERCASGDELAAVLKPLLKFGGSLTEEDCEIFATLNMATASKLVSVFKNKCNISHDKARQQILSEFKHHGIYIAPDALAYLS
jgi:hypothetical protein